MVENKSIRFNFFNSVMLWLNINLSDLIFFYLILIFHCNINFSNKYIFAN